MAIAPLSGMKKPRVIVECRWVEETVPIDQIPASVRPGSVLVLAPPCIKKPEFNLFDGVEVRVYELALGTTTTCGIPSGYGSEIPAILQVA